MKFFLISALLAGLAATILPAAQYRNFDYAAVHCPEKDFEWDSAEKSFHAEIEVSATARYNLYLDMTSQGRNKVTLRVDGKEVPALELPQTARQGTRFLRIKLASSISLAAGRHSIEIQPQAPWRKVAVKALLAEKVTVPRRWQLVWSEEFDTDGFPNPSKWQGEEGLLRNEEPQYYTIGRKENIQVEGGILRITALREKWRNRFYDPDSTDWRKNRKEAEFTSAQIDTYNSGAWQYGKIEARIKLIAGSGRWPAFWTMGIAGGWPEQGEIDIMEFFGKSNNRVTQGLHRAGNDGQDHGVQDWNIKTRDGSPMEGRFHIFSVVWDENKMEFFIDNRKTFEVMRNPEEPWCVDTPQYIILNHAVGRHSGPVPDDVSEMSFYVDYVRVYQ